MIHIWPFIDIFKIRFFDNLVGVCGKISHFYALGFVIVSIVLVVGANGFENFSKLDNFSKMSLSLVY